MAGAGVVSMRPWVVLTIAACGVGCGKKKNDDCAPPEPLVVQERERHRDLVHAALFHARTDTIHHRRVHRQIGSRVHLTIGEVRVRAEDHAQLERRR